MAKDREDLSIEIYVSREPCSLWVQSYSDATTQTRRAFLKSVIAVSLVVVGMPAAREPDTWAAAYRRFITGARPNDEALEEVIHRSFGHLHGYCGVWQDSVCRDGHWYDLVYGYGNQGASWHHRSQLQSLTLR